MPITYTLKYYGPFLVRPIIQDFIWIIWIIKIIAHAMAILTFEMAHSKVDLTIFFPLKVEARECLSCTLCNTIVPSFS
jgi:hypothetical protein